jgi:pilus assembly protein Flp/PilA
MEELTMNNLMDNLIAKLQTLLKNEEGQDLVEYGLVVALIAFGAVAAMQALGTEISTVFSQITSVLQSSIA